MAGGLSPGARAGLARLGARLPFAEAAAALASCWRSSVSKSTARRHTEAAGAAAPAPAGPPRQFLSADGAMVPLVGGAWAEVTTLAVGTLAPGPAPAAPAHLIARSSYSRLADAATVARLAVVETHRRGVPTAGAVVAVTDGSAWLQGCVDDHRPAAVRVLAFPHAVERLTAAAQAACGADDGRAAAGVAAQAHTRKHGDPTAVLLALLDLPVRAAPQPAVAAQARRATACSLAARGEAIQYAAFLAAGDPIGDGAVESADTRIPQARLKGSGMRWARANVNPMLALRTVAANDRWDAAWPPLRAHARAAALARRHARPGSGPAHRPPAAPPRRGPGPSARARPPPAPLVLPGPTQRPLPAGHPRETLNRTPSPPGRRGRAGRCAILRAARRRIDVRRCVALSGATRARRDIVDTVGHRRSGSGWAMGEGHGAATQREAGGGRPEVADILIVGGGPTGLFAAFYAGLRGATATIVDSLEQLGGAVTAMYPEKYIYDVGGFPAVLGKDLIANLAKQAGQFNPRICLNERAQTLERVPDDGVFRLETDKGVHFGKAVIVCAGVGAFAPKKLPLANLPEFEASGAVVYFVTRNEDFRGKEVLIVGGGDSAVDWALTLEAIAAKVTLIHRSDNFRAHAKSVEQLLHSSVNVHTHCEVDALHGTGGELAEVTFRHNKTKETTTIRADAVIMSIGFVADLGPLKTWGLEVQKNQVVADPLTMATNLPGVWAAGDIVTHPTKFKLIATGFHEAITAVNHAVHHINPQARLSAAHSTNLDLPLMKEA